jgi:hypothetical protein
MTDEQLTRIFRSLQTDDLPSPQFADALFARLEGEVPSRRVARTSRPMWVLAAAALLLAALLGIALAVGSGVLKLPVVYVPPASPSASASPTAAPTPASSEGLSAEYQARAQTILDAWEGSGGGLVLVSDGTVPGPGWPPTDNPEAKISLLAGNVVAASPLATETPPPGEVRWDDGTSETMTLLSAAQALENLRTSAVTPCGGCAALVVDQASLKTMSVTTTRGGATVPAWSFRVQGSTATVLRIAVSTGAAPAPGSNVVPDDRSLIDVQSVNGSADSRDLTVHFTGAGAPADQTCGADYAARAYESDTAVVIFVWMTREASLPPGVDGCLAIGYDRAEQVTLAAPLGNRMVFDARLGQPVPVSGP